MTQAEERLKRLILGLGVFQIFIGLGAVAGGLGLVTDPSGGNLGMPVEWLSDSPFQNYLIPGLFLLLVNGGGHLFASVATFRRYRYAGEMAIAFGVILMVWISIQVFWVDFSWLQPLYFVFGLVELLLGLRLRREL